MRAARWYTQFRAWKPTVLAVLAIIAVVVGAVAVNRSASPADTASRADFPTVKPIAKHPVAVFLGGTFTQGAGASAASRSWPELIGEARGWKVVNVASPANDIFSVTGACPASGCVADKSIVASVVSASPRIVIIGAQLDAKANAKSVLLTVAATVRSIRLALPSALIIAVGPVSTPASDDSRVLALDSAYRSIASDNSAVYVSLVSPTGLNASQFAADNSGPNDSGQIKIAQRIQASLSS